MLSYFLALATRPALWMAETLAKAFFRKSGRVAHAASTALAWFLKMPLLFAPFNVEDGVFVPANSWMSIVVLLAIPTQKEYHHALVGCCRVSTSSEKKNWEKEGAPSKKLGLFLKKNHLVLAKRVRLLANELNRSSPPHCNLAGFFDRLVLKRNAFFLVSFRVAGVPFHFFSFLLLLPNSSKKRKQKKKGKNQSIKKKRNLRRTWAAKSVFRRDVPSLRGKARSVHGRANVRVVLLHALPHELRGALHVWFHHRYSLVKCCAFFFFIAFFFRFLSKFSSDKNDKN
jgi:hypothetical protein